MNREYKYGVYVNCLTYNHAPYIRDAFDGFCMQHTNFPFVCGILDDCSTDGEPEIIRQYLAEHFDLEDSETVRHEETDDYKMTYARHKQNQNCYFAVFFLKYNHYQIRKSRNPYVSEWAESFKYRAICEGDDYWTDPQKLQRQVDFLESHPNHSLCIHAYCRFLYKGDIVEKQDVYKYPSDVDIIPDKDVINGTGMFGATASMVYRSSAVEDYPDWTKKAPVGDRPLKFVLFARGHIAYINTIMSVYRKGVPGSWSTRIGRNHTQEQATRKKFVQLLVDFDDWTNKDYHSYVVKALKDYKFACMKGDLSYMISKHFPYLRSLLRKGK